MTIPKDSLIRCMNKEQWKKWQSAKRKFWWEANKIIEKYLKKWILKNAIYNHMKKRLKENDDPIIFWDSGH